MGIKAVSRFQFAIFLYTFTRVTRGLDCTSMKLLWALAVFLFLRECCGTNIADHRRSSKLERLLRELVEQERKGRQLLTNLNASTNVGANISTGVGATMQTNMPTNMPTQWATNMPTQWATNMPTQWATNIPTQWPTNVPTQWPTHMPTNMPTQWPTNMPTQWPTNMPTQWPTHMPTNMPTQWPTDMPTQWPTNMPTQWPTNVPTQWPTHMPTNMPTQWPTHMPTNWPSDVPTYMPTGTPMPTRRPPGPPITQRCPVIRELLQRYLDDFPNGEISDKLDYFHMKDKAREFVRNTFVMFRLVRNLEIICRDAALQLAEYILRNRVRCPATKLKQAIVYIVSRHVERQFTPDEGTLMHNLSRALVNVQFKNEEDKNNFMMGTAWGINHVLFREAEDEMEMSEFTDLERFVQVFRRRLPTFLTKIEGEKRVVRMLLAKKNKTPEVFACTPVDRIFNILRTSAASLRSKFVEETALAMVLTEIRQPISDALQFLTDGRREQVISEIVKVIEYYIRAVMEKISKYETVLVGGVLHADLQPFVFDVLDEERKKYLIQILHHVGIDVPMPYIPTPYPGSGGHAIIP